MAVSELGVRIVRYRDACRRGTGWMLSRQGLDGSLGPVAERLCYYRVPWALALVGERVAAAACLDWIEGAMISEEGEFEGVSPRGIFDQRYGSYPLACLLTGACLLERTDLVRRCLPRLLSWQDPDTGGFFNCREEMDTRGEQELFPTCQAGMTLLSITSYSNSEMEHSYDGDWGNTDYWKGEPFNRPTHAAVSKKTGDIFITDGYGNFRVHKYSPSGEYIKSWGPAQSQAKMILELLKN